MDKDIYAERKAIRLGEWRDWINDFLSLNDVNPLNEYIAIPNAEHILNDYYWRLTLDFLKPLLNERIDDDHKLHYYKIIAASELTIMAVLPFKFKKSTSEKKKTNINAEFAFYVASSIFLNWKINGQVVVDETTLDKIFSYREDIAMVDGETIKYTLNFRDEHILFLELINAAAPLPIMSYSQTWRMIFISAKAILNKGNL